MLRKRRRQLHKEQVDALPGLSPGDIVKVIKVLIVEHPTVNLPFPPEDFTIFMISLQELSAGAPKTRTPAHPIDFPATLECSLQKLPRGKAPGPDLIALEMLQVDADKSVHALDALWQKVVTLNYMPRVLRSGLYAPLFKKDDPSIPSSYRPIMLISTLRKVISSSLLKNFAKHYRHHVRQYGYRLATNTELDVAHVAGLMDKGFKYVAMLDLKKAFDMVPRDRLFTLLESRLPHDLAQHASFLLSPFYAQTKRQVEGNLSAVLKQGVPQGDPSSPFMFNVYVDTLLEPLNEIGPSAIGQEFCDDIILLARDESSMQKLLSTCTKWAATMGMVWSTTKCVYVATHDCALSLANASLKRVTHADYLGVSIHATGVSDHRLKQRLRAAQTICSMLIRTLSKTRLSPSTRLSLVKTFVIPKFDYLLHLQPLTTEVQSTFEAVESQYTRFVLQCSTLSASRLRVARRLLASPSIPILRELRAFTYLVKFSTRMRDLATASAVNELVTLHFALKLNCPRAPVLTGFQKLLQDPSQIFDLIEHHFTDAICEYIAWRRLPPFTFKKVHWTLSSPSLSSAARQIAIMYFMCNLPMKEASWENLKPQLKLLHSHDCPKDTLTNILEQAALIHSNSQALRSQ